METISIKEPSLTLSSEQKRFYECKDRIVFWNVEPVIQIIEATTRTRVHSTDDENKCTILVVPATTEVTRITYSREGLTTACIYLCAMEMMQGHTVFASFTSMRQGYRFTNRAKEMCRDMGWGQTPFKGVPSIKPHPHNNLFFSIGGKGKLLISANTKQDVRFIGSEKVDMFIFDMAERTSFPDEEPGGPMNLYALTSSFPDARFRVVGRSLPSKWNDLGTFFISDSET